MGKKTGSFLNTCVTRVCDDKVRQSMYQLFSSLSEIKTVVVQFFGPPCTLVIDDVKKHCEVSSPWR